MVAKVSRDLFLTMNVNLSCTESGQATMVNGKLIREAKRTFSHRERYLLFKKTHGSIILIVLGVSTYKMMLGDCEMANPTPAKQEEPRF